MYVLEKSLGIEIVRKDNEILEMGKNKKVTKNVFYKIIKEKNEMCIYNVSPLSLINIEFIFVLMELIKIRKGKKLDYISVKDHIYVDYKMVERIVKRETTENGTLNTIDEEQVHKLYNLVCDLNEHSSVWGVKLDSGIRFKTRTLESTVLMRTLEDYALHSVTKKRIYNKTFDTFEEMKEGILSQLNRLEIQEVFSELYAARAEKVLEDMLGFFSTAETKKKLYQHKDLEELEKALTYESNIRTEIKPFMKDDYSGSYVVVDDFLFGIVTKYTENLLMNEVVIEKIGNNDINEPKVVIGMMLKNNKAGI